MAATLTGLGLATPEHSILQEDAVEHALGTCVASDQYRTLASCFYGHSGVEKRHSVLLSASTNGEPAKQSFFGAPDSQRPYGPSTGERMTAYSVSASGLAAEASARALSDARLDPQEVTHLVIVTCTGFESPGVDIELISKLGLLPTIARTSVGFMGCHGAINGLRVAKSFCDADAEARVLMVAVELCTLHYQYGWTTDRIVANSLFADGAAAVVVHGGGDQTGLNLSSSFSEILPNSREAMSWRIGDQGFEMTLSPEVPNLIATRTRPSVQRWLSDQGLLLETVRSWAIHPGGPRILDAAVEALGLSTDDVEASRQVLAEYGNMSSPTMLFVLDRLRRAGADQPCVLLGFGPGLAIEAALLR